MMLPLTILSNFCQISADPSSFSNLMILNQSATILAVKRQL